LEEGDSAPFPGILLPLSRAARLHERIEVCEKERDLAREHFQVSLDIEKSLRKKQVRILEDELVKAREAAERMWYEDPQLLLTVGGGTGLVVGSLATVGFLWLAAQVRIETPVGGN